MSAAIASRRRPSRMASAMRGSSSTSKTRMLRCHEPAHIAGISKTPYVLATPRRLKWRRGHHRAATTAAGGPAVWHSYAPRPPAARPPGRRAPARRGLRSPRGAGVVVVLAGLAAAVAPPSPVSPSPAASPPPGAPQPLARRRGARRDPLGEADGAVPDGATVFDE